MKCLTSKEIDFTDGKIYLNDFFRFLEKWIACIEFIILPLSLSLSLSLSLTYAHIHKYMHFKHTQE